MTIDEAIRHCEEVAEEQEKLYRLCPASESDMFRCDGTKDCITLKNGKNKGCQKCAEEHRQLAEWLKELKEYKEQSGDAISRQAEFNAIYDLCGENVSLKENPWRDNPHMDAVVDVLENLPSVTPQRRTGRWIEVIDETDSLGNKTWHHECSICGSDKSGWGTYKHCPDCGTKMEVKDAD